MKNPNLTKNMPHVKWDQLPPTKGPNPQGENYGNIKNKSTFIKRTIKKVSIDSL
jgi:hypothetical protein